MESRFQILLAILAAVSMLLIGCGTGTPKPMLTGSYVEPSPNVFDVTIAADQPEVSPGSRIIKIYPTIVDQNNNSVTNLPAIFM